MSLLTDSTIGNVAQLTIDTTSSLPTAIIASTLSTSLESKTISTISTTPHTTSTLDSSCFYSNLRQLTDSSSIAQLASSADTSESKSSTSKGNESGNLEAGAGSTTSTIVASEKSKNAAAGSKYNQILNRSQNSWKLTVGIPLFLIVLPTALL